MPDAVCRMLTLLCPLVVAGLSGTHLGVLPLWWILASGRLRGARGAREALFSGLAACGLSASAMRRAWQGYAATTPATLTTLAQAP